MPAFHTRAVHAGVALLGALAVGACAPRAAVPAARPVVSVSPPTIVAENGGRDWMDVYLVHELGEWHLGRLAPGAKMALRLPAAVHTHTTGMVRLAVLAGAARTTQASRDARAILTIPQPVTAVLGQRWTFDRGQFTGHVRHPR